MGTTEPVDLSLHGPSGPISTVGVTTSHVNRRYPLHDKISTMLKSAGYARNSDGNSGSVKGYYELTENWKNGVRRPAESVAYAVAECDNVTILTSTLVHKVIFNASNTRAIAGVAERIDKLEVICWWGRWEAEMQRSGERWL